MPESWYLPNLELASLWPCAALLVVFIPVSFWHERNWRRTLDAYGRARRDAGAPEGEWPPPGVAQLMGVQPRLVLLACALLGIIVAVAIAATLMWPRKPLGFDVPINPLDLPYTWSMIVAAIAAIVAGITIALDARRNRWWPVARVVRRAIYASPQQRVRLFAQALAVDPEVPPAPVPAAAKAGVDDCRT